MDNWGPDILVAAPVTHFLPSTLLTSYCSCAPVWIIHGLWSLAQLVETSSMQACRKNKMGMFYHKDLCSQWKSGVWLEACFNPEALDVAPRDAAQGPAVQGQCDAWAGPAMAPQFPPAPVLPAAAQAVDSKATPAGKADMVPMAWRNP